MKTRLRAVLLALAFWVPSLPARDRDLTFEDRVRAQEAIERVYYSHQLEAAEPFAKAVPRAVLEDKVTRYLKQSVALEQVWKTPVTAEMLAAELRRITSQTREPVRLREIYDSLGNDSVLIQECFARPALVERLTRSFYEGDRGLHAATREKAERLAQHLARETRFEATDRGIARTTIELKRASPSGPDAGGERSVLDRGLQDEETRGVSAEDLEDWRLRLPFRVGEVSEVEEGTDAFMVRMLKGSGPTELRFEQYTVAKQPYDPWWKERQESFDTRSVRDVAAPVLLPEMAASSIAVGPQPESGTCSAGGDSWDSGSLGRILVKRTGHSAVWTGSRMLVWGGDPGSVATGDRYDPLTDTWTPISRTGAPENRFGHTAVWTGTEMIVWGGRNYASPAASLSSGGRYNPATDSWTPTASPPLAGMFRHTAVWTGTEMIVYGGSTGARYNPATNSWTLTETAPWARFFHSAVWTGSKMLVWGGNEGSFGTNTGAAYDPVADDWTLLSTVGVPPLVEKHTAVWTGSRMVVWGGERANLQDQRSTGGIYDPATDTWTQTALVGAPLPRAAHTAVWTGTEMIVWGGRKGFGVEIPYNDGGRFNPVANSWTPIGGSVSAPMQSYEHTAVWTGSRMLVWGGGSNPANLTRVAGRYDPGTDTWTPISLGGGARLRWSHSAVWTGTQMIVWGGIDSSTVPTGDRYDPLLEVWSRLPSSPLSPRVFPIAVWTGSEMVIWGGYNGSVALDSGARYSPSANTWVAMSSSGAPSARWGAPAIWSGSRVVIWGGAAVSGDAPGGGRYVPSTDTWQPITSSGAPAARRSHTSVWTGSQMIVWGGFSYGFPPLNTGGRYLPDTDQWLPLTTTNAPSARKDHVAQWTGSGMLIWGGSNGSTPLANGGTYDPATDSWASVSTSGAPSARLGPTSVWTGTEMILWGANPATDTGGRYNPATNLWADTTLEGAPSARTSHTAIWSGRHMIIWGGVGEYDGGRYAPRPTDLDADGFATCGGDCDDTRAFVHPGASEICDGIDEDCDGALDEGFADADGDGYAGCGGDCNDVDATVHPGANDICNGLDDDCDGIGNNGDWDGDGTTDCFDCNDLNPWVNPTTPEECNGYDYDCDGLTDEGQTDNDQDGYASCVDCHDYVAYIHPGAPEICNQVDDNCNLIVDEGLANEDQDNDGFTVCPGGDCDDTRSFVHPGAPEICDGIDEDCDGLLDEGFIDADGDGYAACGNDCNDASAAIHPDATEICNGVDDDCDGAIDTDTPDADGDGYALCFDCAPGNPAVHPGAIEVCNDQDDDCDFLDDEIDIDGDGYWGCAGGPDCNDGNAAVHPGAAEACNGVDDNCNAAVDDGPDADTDGYNVCQDCNDTNPAIHPGALEPCNGIDDDCSQVVDDPDVDSDGYSGCAGPDCNETDPTVHPGAPEVCDLQDNDCNQLVDEGFDVDGDGFATCNGDCNDADPGVWDFPFEVFGFGPDGASTTDWVWDAQAPFIGPGIVYDVASGSFGPGGVNLSAATCQGTTASTQFTDLQPTPATGQGRWFLVRSKNSCGLGSWGTDSLAGERPVPSCP